MELCERLIEHWRAQGLQILRGCSDAQLANVERKFSFRFPPDFRACYLATDGMGPPEQDKTGFSFWHLDRIQRADIALREAGAHVIPLGAEGYFAFADYLDWSWAYAIRLTESTTENSIVLIGKERLDVVARSFSDFVELYLSDSPQLYGT